MSGSLEPKRQGAQPGNRNAVRHGAFVVELYQKRARELAPRILDANPHLDAMRDGPAIVRYCETLAQIERVHRWIAERGDGDPVFEDSDAAKEHKILDRLDRWNRDAREAERELAITPRERAKLGLDHVRGAAWFEHLRDLEGAAARAEARLAGEAEGP